MARPLYSGWGHVEALEDIWAFIASAVSTGDRPTWSYRQRWLLLSPEISFTGRSIVYGLGDPRPVVKSQKPAT